MTFYGQIILWARRKGYTAIQLIRGHGHGHGVSQGSGSYYFTNVEYLAGAGILIFVSLVLISFATQKAYDSITKKRLKALY